MFEEKDKRYRLVFLKRFQDEVLNNISKYSYLKIVGEYEKKFDTGLSPAIYVNLIIDSEKELENDFVSKFNLEVNECLGTFENYEKYFD